MNESGSVTRRVEQLKAGEDVSAAQYDVFERYLARLINLARFNLPQGARRIEDEEDVANSVLRSVFQRLQNDPNVPILDRKSLWWVLVKLMLKKTRNLRRRAFSPTNCLVQPYSQLAPDSEVTWDEVCQDDEPTADEVAEFTDLLKRGLEQLPREELRETARLVLEGVDNKAIAQRFNRSVRSIERYLQEIVKRWNELEI